MSDHEFVVRLGRANPGNFNGISQLIGGWEIQSKAMYDEVGQPTLADEPIVGTGPYEFMERAQGQYVRFERGSVEHWRLTPDFPELEIRWTSEASTGWRPCWPAKSIWLPSPPTWRPRRSTRAAAWSPATCRASAPSSTSRAPGGAPTGPRVGRKFPDSPLLNQNVRKALSKAINRDELNEAFFKNEAETQVHSHFHPTRLGWNPEWVNRFPAEYGYDPAAARSELAEAGYNQDNPLETNIHMINLTTYAGSLDLIEAVAGYYEEIGVKVNRITMDPATRSARGRAHEFDNHIGLVSTSSDIFLAARVYMTFPPRRRQLPRPGDQRLLRGSHYNPQPGRAGRGPAQAGRPFLRPEPIRPALLAPGEDRH